MARILALDVGEKTIGVAVSDASESCAFPRTTIRRREGHRRDMALLREMVAAEQIERVVVGLPLHDDGGEGPSTLRSRQFAETLRRFVEVPVDLHDERLSTFEADSLLEAAGVRRSERKRMIDSVAAEVILRSYMDGRRAAGAV